MIESFYYIKMLFPTRFDIFYIMHRRQLPDNDSGVKTCESDIYVYILL